jgi:hypothetical protein
MNKSPPLWMLRILKTLLRMRSLKLRLILWIHMMTAIFAPLWMIWTFIYIRRLIFGQRYDIVVFKKESKDDIEFNLDVDLQTLLQNAGSRNIHFGIREAKHYPRLFWQFIFHGFDYDILKDYFLHLPVPRSLITFTGYIEEYPAKLATLEIKLLEDKYTWKLAPAFESLENPMTSAINNIIFKTIYYPF